MRPDRRIRAVARRVTLSDQTAVVQHDEGLGVARIFRIGFGEGAVERLAQGRVGRLDDGALIDKGIGERRRLDAGGLGHVFAVDDKTTQPFAVDRARLERAGDRRTHFAAIAVDRVVHRPVEWAQARPLFFGVETIRIDARDEDRRTQRAAHRTGGDAQHVLTFRRDPGRRAEHDDEDDTQ